MEEGPPLSHFVHQTAYEFNRHHNGEIQDYGSEHDDPNSLDNSVGII